MPFFPEQLEQVIISMNTGLNALDAEIAKLPELQTESSIKLTRQIQTIRDTVQYLSQNVGRYKHEQVTETELGRQVEIANTNSPRI